MVGGALLGDIETRIGNGEAYLSSHPDDAKAQALFGSLVDRHAALCARLAVILDLPEHVRWSRTRDSWAFRRVRLVLYGECDQENDVTREQLRALLESVALARVCEKGE